MNGQANLLRRAVEEKRQYYIRQLWSYGYEKTSDGIDIKDLTLTELEQIHSNVKCQFDEGVVTNAINRK